MAMEHTGKPPRTKSFRTAEVDCDERVSSKKELKHGNGPPPSAAERLTPPWKKSGEAMGPSHVVLVVAEFVTAQKGEDPQPPRDVWSTRRRRLLSAHWPAVGLLTPDEQVVSHLST
jgi:hypothetical protein